MPIKNRAKDINNLIQNINFRIDRLITNYKFKINKDKNDFNLLSHAQKLKENLGTTEELIKRFRPRANKEKLDEIIADLTEMYKITIMEKSTDSKRVVLLEQKTVEVNKKYEKFIEESKTLQERILEAKQKKERVRMEIQQLEQERTSKIERIMKNKASKKIEEEVEQKERTDRITNAINRIKTDKKKEINKSNSNIELAYNTDNNIKNLETYVNTQQIQALKNESPKNEKNVQEPKGNKISFIDRFKSKLKSFKGKDTTDNKKKKRKLPWIVAVPLSALFAISFVNDGRAGERADNLQKNNNSYTDGVTPDDSQANINQQKNEARNNMKWETNKHSNNGNYNWSKWVNDVAKNNNPDIVNKYDKENEYNTPTYVYTEKEDDSNKDDSNKNDNKSNSHDSSTENTENKKSVIVNIGDKIKVEEGLEYTETCYGEGNSNYIGAVSWRPATEYSIEKVAFAYQGKVLSLTDENTKSINDDLNKIAEKYNINADEIETKVLLSLVPESYDTGWASINIDNMQKNIVKSDFKVQDQTQSVVKDNSIER